MQSLRRQRRTMGINQASHAGRGPRRTTAGGRNQIARRPGRQMRGDDSHQKDLEAYWIQRPFRKAARFPNGVPSSEKFTMMTWNVLAGHAQPGRNTWAERLPIITHRILWQQPDVICLQEVEFEKNERGDLAIGCAAWHLRNIMGAQGYHSYMNTNVLKQNSVMVLWRTKTFKEAVDIITPEQDGGAEHDNSRSTRSPDPSRTVFIRIENIPAEWPAPKVVTQNIYKAFQERGLVVTNTLHARTGPRQATVVATLKTVEMRNKALATSPWDIRGREIIYLEPFRVSGKKRNTNTAWCDYTMCSKVAGTKEMSTLALGRSIFVPLRHRMTDRLVLVCAAHLRVPLTGGSRASSPKFPELPHNRVQMAADYLPYLDIGACLKEIEHFKRQNEQEEVSIIMGVDMNSLPDQPAVKLATNGILDFLTFETTCDQMCLHSGGDYWPAHSRGILVSAAHDLNLDSAMRAVLGSEPEATTYNNLSGFKGTLDYALYSKDTLECLEVQDTYPSSAKGFENGFPTLPSPVLPSDHLPIFCQFRITNYRPGQTRSPPRSPQKASRVQTRTPVMSSQRRMDADWRAPARNVTRQRLDFHAGEFKPFGGGSSGHSSPSRPSSRLSMSSSSSTGGTCMSHHSSFGPQAPQQQQLPPGRPASRLRHDAMEWMPRADQTGHDARRGYMSGPTPATPPGFVMQGQMRGPTPAIPPRTPEQRPMSAMLLSPRSRVFQPRPRSRDGRRTPPSSPLRKKTRTARNGPSGLSAQMAAWSPDFRGQSKKAPRRVRTFHVPLCEELD